MKRLSKAQLKELTDYQGDIEGARDELEAALASYNSLLEGAWEEHVASALAKLNAEIEAADSWRTEIADQLQEYFDERSDAWQEGDTGSAYGEWLDAWGESLEPVELDRPDDVETPEVEAVDALSSLSGEPGA